MTGKPALPAWACTGFNIVGFQAVWLLCVIGAGRGNWLPGVLAALLFAALMLRLSGDRRRDMQTVALALPVGFAVDSLLAGSPLISYASPFPSLHWAPAWIMALWLGFAFTLNHSLKSIYRNPTLLLLFGGLGAPLSYYIAAEKFNATELAPDSPASLLLVGLAWGAGLSLIRWLDATLDSRRDVKAKA